MFFFLGGKLNTPTNHSFAEQKTCVHVPSIELRVINTSNKIGDMNIANPAGNHVGMQDFSETHVCLGSNG